MVDLPRSNLGHRSTHSNPIIEHLFQRFEAGEPLLQICENMTGWKYQPHGSRAPAASDDPVERFMLALVLATVAPGTEFQRDERIARTADLADAQDENRRFQE